MEILVKAMKTACKTATEPGHELFQEELHAPLQALPQQRPEETLRHRSRRRFALRSTGDEGSNSYGFS